MIVYNTTFYLENAVCEEGITFLKEVYLPKASASGFLLNPLLRRVIPGGEKEEGMSYSVQFHVKNVDVLHLWLESEGSVLQQELVARFGRQIVGFSTLLEEIEWKK